MLALALIALNFLIHWSPRAGGAPSAEGAEARLYNLLEPVAGEGQLRLSLTRRADGGQTLLVLLDRASPADRRVIADLASASGLISLEAGDTVTLKDIEFAPGFAARLSPLEMAEAGCLVLLIGASGMLLMRTLMLPHTVGRIWQARRLRRPARPKSPAQDLSRSRQRLRLRKRTPLNRHA
jgi:hypothetical protein